MKKLYTIIAYCIINLSITGCSVVDGQGRYRVATIGNAKRSVEAVIIKSEPVLVKTGTTGVGALTGGTTGGVLTLTNSNNVGIIIAGIVGGMIVGNAIEDLNGVYEATEYVIRTSNEAIYTVVQINNNNPKFQLGDKVILVYGYPSRLIRNR